MAKTTKVKLTRQYDGEQFEFEVDHAERILNIKDSGWELPEDSQYEFKDGIISTRDKGKGKQA
jgi:hypothetical protein